MQEAYEHAVPKFFSATGTPPIFEDQFSSNKAYTKAPLNYLVDIHTGGYEYQLIDPDNDIPAIVEYLKWFIDSFRDVRMDPEQKLFFDKIVKTYEYYRDWKERVERAFYRRMQKDKGVRSFAEGGYVK